jgi:hypothetical protein
MAIGILVLALVGLLCCPLTSPVAWLLGHREVQAARRGEAPAGSQSLAQVGMLLGILGTVLLAFTVLLVFALGALAVAAALLGH